MFDIDDDGGLIFEATTSEDELAIISITRTSAGDWCARVSLSSDAEDVQICDIDREYAAATAVEVLGEMLGTAHRRLEVLGPHYEDDDYPRMAAMSHDDLQRALAVSESEAARRMSVSPSSLRRMRERGEAPPARRVGERRVVYLVSDIKAWLEERPVAL